MVQFSSQLHHFDAPIQDIALAHSLRFPSPYSTHVISSDVISRTLTSSGTILTTRLILKRGKMPNWAPKSMVDRSTSWVLEQVEVDLEGQELEVRARSRNIEHKIMMEVCEWQLFKPTADPTITEATTITRVISETSFWPIRNRIEKFGISRVPKSSEKARAGLTLALSLLLPPTRQRFLNSGPLTPYPFDPLPTSLTLASELVRNKLAEARKRAKEREERGEEKIWRKRWGEAVRRGVEGFKRGVCKRTGLLCDEGEKIE